MPDESELRAAFHELRAFERARTPAFLRTGAPASAGPHHVVLRNLAAAALVVIVLLTFGVLVRNSRAVPDPSWLSAWTAPTDFLLNTPQVELLRTVPRFGIPQERNGIQ